MSDYEKRPSLDIHPSRVFFLVFLELYSPNVHLLKVTALNFISLKSLGGDDVTKPPGAYGSRWFCATVSVMKKGVDYTGITVAFLCHDGQGNYVMHRRSQNCRDEHGRWDFGGGALHFNETIERCLEREVKEEFSVSILSANYLGHNQIFREQEGVATHWICFYYQVHVDRDKVVNNEPDKHDEMNWFKLDNLPQPLHSMILQNMDTWKKNLI